MLFYCVYTAREPLFWIFFVKIMGYAAGIRGVAKGVSGFDRCAYSPAVTSKRDKE